MKKEIKLIFIFVIIYNMIYNVFLTLHPDEAYYWVWTKHPDLSYFDHPPMVSWLIKISTLFSDAHFFVRLGAVVSMSIAGIMIYRTSKAMFGQKTGEISLMLFLAIPIVQIGFLVMTPDAPVIMFWAVLVNFIYKALFENKTKYLYYAGIAGGLMLLSKYTGVLIYPALIIFVLTTDYRKVFSKKEFYLSIILTVIVFSPVLVWNYLNDWASFRFQFSHGIAEEKIFNGNMLAEFFGAQIGVFNPIFFFTLLIYLCKNIKRVYFDKRLYFLSLTFLFPFLFFIYQSAFKKAEVNWAAPSFITAIILLAFFLVKYNMKKLFTAGIIFTIILVVLVKFPEFFPNLPEQIVLKNKFYGYEVLQEGKKYINKDTIVCSDSYQNASEVWYYMKPDNVNIITKSRYSMYDIWYKKDKRKIGNEKSEYVFFTEDNKIDELKTMFTTVAELDRLNYQNLFSKRSFFVYRCTGKRISRGEE